MHAETPSGYPVKPVSRQLTPRAGSGHSGRETSRTRLQGQGLELSPPRPLPTYFTEHTPPTASRSGDGGGTSGRNPLFPPPPFYPASRARRPEQPGACPCCREASARGARGRHRPGRERRCRTGGAIHVTGAAARL